MQRLRGVGNCNAIQFGPRPRGMLSLGVSGDPRRQGGDDALFDTELVDGRQGAGEGELGVIKRSERSDLALWKAARWWWFEESSLVIGG